MSLGQRGRAEERITYLKQAIAEHGDCFYGDGVQVGAYARLLLGRLYFEDADPDKAKTLFDEIRNSYADAVDHQGRSLLAQLPARDRSPVNVVESNPPPRRLPVQLATGLLAAIALVCVVGFVSRSLAPRRMNDPSGIADSYIPAWQEVESKVYCPALGSRCWRARFLRQRAWDSRLWESQMSPACHSGFRWCSGEYSFWPVVLSWLGPSAVSAGRSMFVMRLPTSCRMFPGSR